VGIEKGDPGPHEQAEIGAEEAEWNGGDDYAEDEDVTHLA
jgi:hypothetical protein